MVSGQQPPSEAPVATTTKQLEDTVIEESYVETKEDIMEQVKASGQDKDQNAEGKPEEGEDDEEFDFEEYFDDDDDYYDEEDYYDEDAQEDQMEEREEYAKHLRTFMDDFEPSDQLTTEIEPHATQAYQIRVSCQPTLLKTAMALTNDYPEPVIVKMFKKGIELPIKDLRGKTEVLDVIEIIEDDDIGTYILEFTNTSSQKQDLTFILKQIEVQTEAEKNAETEEAIKQNKLS